METFKTFILAGLKNNFWRERGFPASFFIHFYLVKKIILQLVNLTIINYTYRAKALYILSIPIHIVIVYCLTISQQKRHAPSASQHGIVFESN